jgi:large subunit ribosomal protein L9
MEILLREDVPKLGRRGEIVKVAEGYARNYLFPQNLAVKVSVANVKQVQEEKKRIAVLEQRKLDDLKAEAQRLSSVSVTIQAKANEEGHLFGSVTEVEIAAAVKGEGYAVEPSMVRMESHLKELGMFEVKIVLHEGVDATVKVWVVAE